MIPKIAHFVWLGAVPDWANRTVEAFREMHHGWKVNLHRGPAEGMSPELQRQYDRCEQLCQQADILYCDLLLRFGGMVMDCDSIPARNHTPLLDRRAFTSRHSSRDRRLTNGIMGSMPGTVAFNSCCEFIECFGSRRLSGQEGRCAFGPNMLTQLHDNGQMPDLTVLPWHWFYPWDWGDRSIAHRWLDMNAADREQLLRTYSDRFIDGVMPFSVHLWGYQGSSQRKVSELVA